MPEGGSIAGLDIEAGLGFGGGSRFGVGLGLGLDPRSSRRRPHSRVVVSSKGCGDGTRDGAGQDPSLAAKATHVVPPVVEEASGIHLGSCSPAWETTW